MLYYLGRDTTSETMAPGPFFYIDHNLVYLIFIITSCRSVFTLLFYNYIFHTIRLILCIQQDGKLDNLPGKLGTKGFVFVCRSTTNLAEDSYWFDKPWFLTEGNLLLHYITPSSWGSQRGVIYTKQHVDSQPRGYTPQTPI